MVEDAPDMTAEELIVYTARVSNPSNQMNTETAPRLLGFLMRKKHWSPFEQADMTVEVQTSRGIAAQILRHWSLSVQEFSQRYASVADGAVEPIQLRVKGATNRQGSIDALEEKYKMYYDSRVGHHIEDAFALYNELVSEQINVAPECARFILPLATQTTMYLKGNIRDWIHYLSQRTDPHAQHEHRLVAFEIEKIFQQHFPNIYQAIQDNKFEPELLTEFLQFCDEHFFAPEGFGFSVSNRVIKDMVKAFTDHKHQQLKN